MIPITCNEDLRRLAMRRAPRAIFDYVDRGSYDEATIRANRAALGALQLRQRVMIDVSQRALATTLVGEHAGGAGAKWGSPASCLPTAKFWRRARRRRSACRSL